MKIFKKVSIAIPVVLLIAFFGYQAIVSALAYNIGYFTNHTMTGIGYGNVLTDGLSSSATGSKSGFINEILADLNKSGSYNNDRDSTGAAFIIQTMRGGNDRNLPDSTDIEDWKARVNNSAVTMTVDYYSYSRNSGYARDTNAGASGDDDDAYYDYPGYERSLLFSVAGEILFAIKIDCGNPVGDLPGLDSSPQWNVVLTINATKSNGDVIEDGEFVTVGEKITWAYRATITGTTPTNRLVTYGYDNSGGTNTTDNPNVGSFAIGTIPGATSGQYYSTHEIVTGDVGSQICSRAQAIPTSSSNLAMSYSVNKCVNVVVISATDCRPIIIHTPSPLNDPKPGTTDKIRVEVDGDSFGNVTSSTTINFATYGGQNRVDDYTDGRIKVVEYYQLTHDWVPPEPPDPVTGAGGSDGYWEGVDNYWYDAFQCYDYSITAKMSDLSYDGVETGSLIEIDPEVVSKSYTGFGGVTPGVELHTRTKTSNWQISQLVISPGAGNLTDLANANENGDSNDDPCDYYESRLGVSSSSVSCSVAKSINSASSDSTTNLIGKAIFSTGGSYSSAGSGSRNPYSYPYIKIGDTYAPGTRICFAFSVYANTSEPNSGEVDDGNSDDVPHLTPLSTDGGSWNHSSLYQDRNCVLVVKKPKVQVLGSDLVTGKGSSLASNSKVVTSTSVKKLTGRNGMKLFGSWDEYGILAFGSINGMASASAFNFTTGLTIATGLDDSIDNTDICNYSRLSFSNRSGTAATSSTTCSASNIGGYSNTSSLPDLATLYKTTDSTPVILSGRLDDDHMPNGSTIYRTSGNLTIDGGIINKNKWVVINAGNYSVTIAKDLRISNANMNDIFEIPQIVIIAKNIYISGTVENVDAWLIAKDGKINTCYEKGDYGNLSTSDCDRMLTVNGPVMTAHLYLRRTAGSGNQEHSGDPAEVFNLRPDAYLWAYVRASEKGMAETTYVTDLPPRF